MSPIEQYTNLLVQLGLSYTQAKIFLALCTGGTCTVRAVAENAGVAREIVYQVMPILQEKGLIETVISSPQEYRAIPVEDAFEVLVNQKSAEKKRLLRNVRDSVKSLKLLQKGPLEQFSQIAIVPQGKTLASRVIVEFKKAQIGVEAIVCWPEFVKWNQLYAEKELNEALKRKIRIRIIIERTLTETTKKPLLDTLLVTSPYFERIDFRIVKNYSLVNMMIFDEKRMFLQVADNKSLFTSSLYSNNPCLVRTANTYFKHNWEAATLLKDEERIQDNEEDCLFTLEAGQDSGERVFDSKNI